MNVCKKKKWIILPAGACGDPASDASDIWTLLCLRDGHCVRIRGQYLRLLVFFLFLFPLQNDFSFGHQTHPKELHFFRLLSQPCSRDYTSRQLHPVMSSFLGGIVGHFGKYKAYLLPAWELDERTDTALTSGWWIWSHSRQLLEAKAKLLRAPLKTHRVTNKM